MREKSIYIQFEDFYCAACVGNAQSRNTFCLCIFKKQTKTETNKQTSKQAKLDAYKLGELRRPYIFHSCGL